MKISKITKRLTVSYSLIIFTALAIIGSVVFFSVKASISNMAFSHLISSRVEKKRNVEEYFGTIRKQMLTMSENLMVVDAMKELNGAFNEIKEDSTISDSDIENMRNSLTDYYNGEFSPRLEEKSKNNNTSINSLIPAEKDVVISQFNYISSNINATGEKDNLNRSTDSSNYADLHSKYHPVFRSFLKEFMYYDIFLVDLESGHIVYSVFKEIDYGTSLLTGPYSNTNFAQAFIEAKNATTKDFVKLVDFEPYIPSYNAPASFISSPIYDGDEKIGVLIFQMPVDKINEVMTGNFGWQYDGFGESGETYIVSEDYKMRSISRFLVEDPDGYFSALREHQFSEDTIQLIKNYETTILLQEVRTTGVEKALAGETDNMVIADYREIDVLSSFAPLKIEDVNWVILSEIDYDEAMATMTTLTRVFLSLVIVILLICILISFRMAKRFTEPLLQLRKTVKQLSKGKLPNAVKTNQTDEIAATIHDMNTFVSKLKVAVDFSEKLGKGDFKAKYKNRQGKDAFAKSLLQLRGKLSLAEDERANKQKKDKDERWITEGIALFDNVIRQNNLDLTQLSKEVVSHVINRLQINQGSLFILEKEDDMSYMQLMATYAYDRHKFTENNKVAINQGLVGQCWAEKSEIILENVPSNYARITSGLGELSPSYVMLLPLIYNDQLFGVLEVAALRNLAPFEISYLKKICTVLASSISMVKANNTTNQLLQQSQHLAEQMRSQEEELRQNMEEMQATQEEMKRKEAEYISEIKELRSAKPDGLQA